MFPWWHFCGFLVEGWKRKKLRSVPNLPWCFGNMRAKRSVSNLLVDCCRVWLWERHFRQRFAINVATTDCLVCLIQLLRQTSGSQYVQNKSFEYARTVVPPTNRDQLIWRFPKIGVLPNHPLIDGIFHELNQFYALGVPRVPPWLWNPLPIIGGIPSDGWPAPHSNQIRAGSSTSVVWQLSDLLIKQQARGWRSKTWISQGRCVFNRETLWGDFMGINQQK